MEVLRSLSMLYALSFSVVIFLMLYDLRFDRKKNIIITIASMGPPIIIASSLIFIFGPDAMAQMFFAIVSIPSFIYFLLMAKKRDGRFFFTFCLVSTLCFEVIAGTILLDELLGGGTGVILCISRLILMPLLTFTIWKYCSKPYKEIQLEVHEGWSGFAIVSALYYVLLVYMFSFPVMIPNRPEDIPDLLLVFLIMPLTYLTMLRALMGQRRLHLAEELRNNADRQNETMRIELAREQEYVEAAKSNRHDMRHVVAVARDYIAKGNVAGADKYLSEFADSVTDDVRITYCDNAVVNALLSITARRCAEENVACVIQAQIPEELPYQDTETGTLFGNLFENACEAAKLCKEPFLHIHAEVRNEKLLLSVRNSVSNDVVFREDGIPVTTKVGGGIGVRSAKRVIEKYGGLLRLKQEDDVFITQIVQKL